MEWNGMGWNGMGWNGMEVVRYRVTNNGLAIKVSIGNEVSIKIAISFMHFLTTNRDFLMKNETKFRYYIDNKIINIKRKKNEEFILFFFIKNIFYLNINRRIFLYVIYRISINLSSFTDRDGNETYYRNNFTDP